VQTIVHLADELLALLGRGLSPLRTIATHCWCLDLNAPTLRSAGATNRHFGSVSRNGPLE
jgi:hypothetical protein